MLTKDYAYETDKGVYFDESKFKDFGKLSNRNLEDLNVHRIGPDTSKGTLEILPYGKKGK